MAGLRLRTRRLFLDRRAYRRRRMIEATRLVPVLLALAVVLPPLWLPQRFSFAGGTLWLAVGWLTAIVATAALNRAIGAIPVTEDEDDA
ncbi:hypothetical protein GL279_17655 [Paracoccus limosus]|uniref:Uncharacterized protein n=1 Tax=Paracoccus limosus TaxID=913252 RepID=A0A844H9S9_9RHOB|nr:hypothetical protein [Paracoccus limosus]MTH36420.1 hypothetical protein [Paracoccus limosus]